MYTINKAVFLTTVISEYHRFIWNFNLAWILISLCLLMSESSTRQQLWNHQTDLGVTWEVIFDCWWHLYVQLGQQGSNFQLPKWQLWLLQQDEQYKIQNHKLMHPPQQPERQWQCQLQPQQRVIVHPWFIAKHELWPCELECICVRTYTKIPVTCSCTCKQLLYRSPTMMYKCVWNMSNNKKKK